MFAWLDKITVNIELIIGKVRILFLQHILTWLIYNLHICIWLLLTQYLSEMTFYSVWEMFSRLCVGNSWGFFKEYGAKFVDLHHFSGFPICKSASYKCFSLRILLIFDEFSKLWINIFNQFIKRFFELSILNLKLSAEGCVPKDHRVAPSITHPTFIINFPVFCIYYLGMAQMLCQNKRLEKLGESIGVQSRILELFLFYSLC